MDNDIIIVEESHLQNGKKQGENVIQNQSDLARSKHVLKMGKQGPMHPTPLEYPCCFTHLRATALCLYIVFTCLVITSSVLLVCLTAPKPARRTCEYQLRPTVQYSTRDSSHPQSIAVADFNSDGHTDIVIATSGFDNVIIFFGYGDNSFPNQISYSMGIGSQPRMVAVADFNSDHRSDIVVANFGTNNLLILFGNGNGTFPSQTTIETSPSRPLYVVAGDLNNDGCSDIVFAGYGTNNIGLLLGFCNSTFQAIRYFTTGYDSLPYSIALGDFNQDDRLDISVVHYGTDNVGIFLGYGNGTFTNQTTYTTGTNSRPHSIAIADLNNDTHMDFAIVNSKTDNMKLFFGHGNGSFHYLTSYYTGRNSNPIFITIADFNNDDILDITIVNNGTETIMLYFGHWDGTFVDPKKYSTGPRSSPCAIGVGDFNNDNQLDVAIANEQSSNIKIFNSKTAQTFSSERTFPTSKNSSSIGMQFISTGTDSDPTSLIVGDFNNDNQLDLASANYWMGGVVVLLADKNGRFSPPMFYSTGDCTYPYSIIAADFNSDGHSDIALACANANNVAILLGYGHGEFSPPMTYSTGIDSSPTCVAVGDFNNDGRLDISVANPGTNNVDVFLGYGNGEFAPHTVYSTVNISGPMAIGVADFNNDGRLDIVFVSRMMNKVGILLAHNSTEFLLRKTYFTGYGSEPAAVANGDFKKDGQLDIAVALFGENSVCILLGYGNGEFSSQKTYFIGTDCRPFSIAVDDLNNDGCADIVVANYYTGSVGILFGYDDGKFSSPNIYLIGTNTHPRAIVVADFNKDDRLDIAVANPQPRNVAVLLGQGNGTFPYITYSTKTSRCSVQIAVGDFNSDGRLDIAVAKYDTDSVGIILGHGNGSFESQPILSTGKASSPLSIVVADFNNDTRSDIAVANFDTDNIGIFLGYGDGDFASQSTYSTGVYSRPISLAVNDFNNDGRLDIVVANFNAGGVSIFLGNGHGKFSPQISYFAGDKSYPISVAVADFNRDGPIDIAALYGGTSTVGIRLGNGDGTFQTQKIFSTGIFSYSTSLALGDLNNDDIVDIAVANSQNFEEHLFILLGDGQGNFSNHGKYRTDTNSKLCSIIIADLDNDSHLDIAATNNNSKELVVFPGYGDGTFGSQNSYSTTDNSYPISLAIGDFNNDNLTDIAVANYGTDIVGVFLAFIDTKFIDNTALSTGSAAFPRTIALSDFTNDGQLDIVVGNDGTHDIDLFINDGKGNFSLQNAYLGDSTFYPTSMVVHDFNDDTRLDLAVANSATNTISVLHGRDNGTFEVDGVFSTGIGSSPQSVAIGDFNNDNKTDIAVAYSEGESVGLLLKIDKGALESMQTFATGSNSKPHGLTVADFDNDGHVDIVVANNGNANIGIFFGFDNGSFSEQYTVPIGEDMYPQWVGSGDFNNDKQLDIVVSTNIGSTPVIVLLNNGDRSFRVEKIYGLTAAYEGVVGDFNADGYLDVFLCLANEDTTGVLFGDGHSLSSYVRILRTTDGLFCSSVAVDDFNNDDQLDIAVAYNNAPYIGIFFGHGSDTFLIQDRFPTNSFGSLISITTGDFNHDAFVDIAVGISNGGHLNILFGLGDGTFPSVNAYQTGDHSFPQSINSGDFNNDGQLDIVIANSDSGNIGVLLGHYDDIFFKDIAYSTGNHSHPFSIGLGDFNNDGRLDVAVSNMLSDSIGVFLGYASEDFVVTAAKPIGELAQPVSIATADLNNDSYLDVVVADRRNNKIIILQGSGRGTFSSQTNYSTGDGSHPSWVAINHFNQDQYLDVAVVNSGTNDIGIFLGDTDGSFSSMITFSTGISSLPLSLAASHFNDDTHLDISVANFGSNNVCLLFGYGNGSFESPECYTSGYDSRPFAVASGDVNGDNLTDVVIANKGSSTINILTKIC